MNPETGYYMDDFHINLLQNCCLKRNKESADGPDLKKTGIYKKNGALSYKSIP